MSRQTRKTDREVTRLLMVAQTRAGSPTSTATPSKKPLAAWKVFAVTFLVIALIGGVYGAKHHARNCYNNGITIVHGSAYHGSCDPNAAPSTHPDGTN